MNELWVEKYKPKILDDVIISDHNINIIKKWISNFEKNKNKILILHGSPGIGKTTLANIILKEYNYDVVELNTSDIRNQKLIREQLNNIFNKQNVLSIMINRKKLIGIIMDELDGITSGERSGLTEFINLINPKKNKFVNPIICTTNSISEKKIQEIMKYSVTVKINNPNRKDLLKLIDKICINENIELNETQKLNISKKSQSDFRRLVNMMSYIFEFKTIYNVDQLISNYSDKNIDLKLFESVDKILNTYNLNNIIKYYETDKNLISMLIYENFLTEILLNINESYETKIRNLTNIYDNFSEADIFDYNIMINHQHKLSDYCGVYKCVITSFLINNMEKYSFKKTQITYSKLLNKTSLEYLNYKSLDYILKQFKLHCSTNIHQIFSDFIVFLLSKDETKSIGMEIINKYEYNIKNIDKIIKNSYDVEKNKKKLINIKKI